MSPYKDETIQNDEKTDKHKDTHADTVPIFGADSHEKPPNLLKFQDRVEIAFSDFGF